MESWVATFKPYETALRMERREWSQFHNKKLSIILPLGTQEIRTKRVKHLRT